MLDLVQNRQTGQNGAPVCGVIVYTDENANVKKLLRDEDYWTAMDQVSGLAWAVFSIRARPGKWIFRSPPSGMVAFMVPVWKEPAANRELLDVFSLDDTKGLPSLVVFAMVREELHRAVVKFYDSTVDLAYASLKGILGRVSTALDGIPEADCSDPETAFGAAQ